MLLKAYCPTVICLLVTTVCGFALESTKGFKSTINPLEALFDFQRVAPTEAIKYNEQLLTVCSEFFAEDANPQNLEFRVSVDHGHAEFLFFENANLPNPPIDERFIASLKAVETPKGAGTFGFTIEGRVAGGINETIVRNDDLKFGWDSENLGWEMPFLLQRTELSIMTGIDASEETQPKLSAESQIRLFSPREVGIRLPSQ